uniref:(northern house mosquito) hypothetical protein n=1 Tax=Culex pipiens TaxID=7175 RepID=A0A8D8CV05_CULPI
MSADCRRHRLHRSAGHQHGRGRTGLLYRSSGAVQRAEGTGAGQTGPGVGRLYPGPVQRDAARADTLRRRYAAPGHGLRHAVWLPEAADAERRNHPRDDARAPKAGRAAPLLRRLVRGLYPAVQGGGRGGPQEEEDLRALAPRWERLWDVISGNCFLRGRGLTLFFAGRFPKHYLKILVVRS